MAFTALSKTNGIKNEIKKGTALITAKPFAFVLSSRFKQERCDFCFKRGKLLKCSACHDVSYCSRNCQKPAWTIHKIECAGLKKIKPRSLPDAARMLGKIIIKLSQGGESERGYYTATKYRTFNDLMSHVEDIKMDESKMEHFTSLRMILSEYLPGKIIPELFQLLEIFGRMSVNSFNILDTDLTSLGVGIYLGPSIVDHSCTPNAAAIFEGTELTLRALCDLPALDWSKVFIPYIDLLTDTKTRRADLQRSYYFICNCTRCKTPESIEIAAACPNQKCTNACSPGSLACSKCGEKFPPAFQEKYDQVSEIFTFQLHEMQHTAFIDIAEKCLEKREGVLHPYNLLVVRMLEVAVTATIDLNSWEKAEIYASQLIPLYLYYFGDSHPTTGQMYFLWAKLLSFLNRGDQALEVGTKAAQVIKTAFGEGHSTMIELRRLLDQLITEYNIKNNY